MKDVDIGRFEDNLYKGSSNEEYVYYTYFMPTIISLICYNKSPIRRPWYTIISCNLPTTYHSTPGSDSFTIHSRELLSEFWQKMASSAHRDPTVERARMDRTVYLGPYRFRALEWDSWSCHKLSRWKRLEHDFTGCHRHLAFGYTSIFEKSKIYIGLPTSCGRVYRITKSKRF